MRERERGGGREAPPCAVFISGALKAVRERELADGCKLHATKNNRLAPKRRFSEAENFSCIFFSSLRRRQTIAMSMITGKANDANDMVAVCTIPFVIIEFS